MKKRIYQSLVALVMICALGFGSMIEAKANCVASGTVQGACLSLEYENVPCEFAEQIGAMILELEIDLGCWD